MKIQNIEYYDQEYEWRLDPVEFTTNPTLLVGISGAGKTQILRSIFNLKKIVNGASLNGVKWNTTFNTENGTIYRWEGEFETQRSFISSEQDLDREYKIIIEKLYKNDNIIIDRTEEKINFNGTLTPKLSPNESALHLLKLEEDISPAADEINKITMVEFAPYEGIQPITFSLLKKYEKASLSEIQESGLPISIKLSLVYRSFREVFEEIKTEFSQIFNQIEDVKIEPLRQDDIPIVLADFLRESTVVYFKEKGINNWIRQPYISSGMFKTLMYISELYLSPKGSVMLIDEFENSLGVNCLDSITEIVTENKDLQFILTSHHPYIINNISPKHWKIVTRKGGVVQVKDSQELGISKSREKAFIDLINILEDYPELEGDGE
ncbi:ATP-binding protein [Phormidium pseudopriestleyi FRX01]|uniref:ATP-binding protein n=1 Tax=Phormidium pseudopriestleyi FRX01 TaxID=1759528 RepID=A0ABS3FMX3_9CYAN|nr:AAA family ATPase [Phormidium pseudopriestleyi]MBO0348388.1 ATP-binding protein [Phormidium pseudopriestleyi FRX01]